MQPVFIQNLSDQVKGTVTDKPAVPTPFLIAEKRASIKKEISTIYKSLVNKEHVESIKFYAGKHCTVFEHKLFPGFIFKLMSLSEAQKREQETQIAKEVAKQQCLNFCFVPNTEVIDLEMKLEVVVYGDYSVRPPIERKEPYYPAVLVEEKMDGSVNHEAQRISEMDFEQAESLPELKQKLTQIYRQAALFICKVGYWDFDWRNAILLKNLEGLAFIDFEHTKPEHDNIALGLVRLIKIAPPFVIEEIFKIAEQHGVDLIKEAHKNNFHKNSKTAEAFAKKRVSTLNKRKKFLAWLAEKGITSPNQSVSVKEGNKLENYIVQIFNKSLPESLYTDLIFSRTFFIQPFIFDKKIDPSAYNQALDNLKAQGVIYSWKVNKLPQPELNRYMIKL